MPSPFLTTKLHAPPLRPNLTVRPRLQARLDNGLQPGQRLMLIAAPAGFGKTTLMAEWLAVLSARTAAPLAAWLSLDEGDNDPVRFIRYVIAALQIIDPTLGEAALDLLQSPLTPDTASIEIALTALINDLAAQANGLLCVLDDYHLITATAVHAAVAFLLDRLPASTRLIISGRSDPPLPLPRWRARGWLTELRAPELRFTPEETAAFINQMMGLGLSPDEVAALDARTEGWIAGLQLAAVSMQGRADLSQFLAAFTSSNRYILDYLVEEVLYRQPADVQQFLLQTAILERMTGPLCDALTDRADGQLLLEQLEHANVFIIPLDQDQTWYRYHAIFAEALRRRLRQLSPAMPAELHRRASDWYARHSLSVEAISHALLAGDFEQAAGLIEPLARDWAFVHSETVTVLHWLELLPGEVLSSRPRLKLARTWALIAAGRHAEAETQIEELHRSAEATLPGEIAATQTYVSVLHGDVTRTIELAQQALKQLPDDERFLRGLVALNLGLAYDQRGDMASASQAYEEAGAIGRAAHQPFVVSMAAAQLADIKHVQGRLLEARENAERAIRSTRQAPVSSMAYLSLGRVLYERNELDEAAQALSACLELGQHWASADMRLAGLVQLAQVRWAQGDRDLANELNRQATRIMNEQMVSAMTVAMAQAQQARLWINLGQRAAAVRWAHAYEQRRAQAAPSVQLEIEATTLARVWLMQGQAQRVRDTIEPACQAAEQAGRISVLIEWLTLHAISLELQDRSADAQRVLLRALYLGEPGDFVRTFVDFGALLKSLLIKLAPRFAYAGRLLEASGIEPQPPASTPGTLIEPLSDRELQVLRLIAEGLSNQEMAARLVIAPSTIKTHINNLYGKLGVQTRTQALLRARELNLM